MPEEHLKWSYDADIEIDYTQNPAKIHFMNIKRIDSKYVLKVVVLSLIISLSIVILIWTLENQKSNTQAYVYFFTLTFFCWCFISLGGTLLFSSYIFIKLYMKLITRKVRRSLTVTNPEGTIIYRTRVNHVMDIVYDEKIRPYLIKVSLIKIKTKPKGSELTIVLSQKAYGKLKIKEY